MLETGLVGTQLHDKLYSVIKYYCNKVSLQKWFKSQLIYEHFYIFFQFTIEHLQKSAKH